MYCLHNVISIIRKKIILLYISIKMPRTRKARRGGRKSVPWKGWGRQAPKQGRERTRMLRDCGKKCFLGPNKSFPVCTKGTCRKNLKGYWAAYIRAKEWGNPRHSYRGKARPTHRRRVYTGVARRAKRYIDRHSRRRRR